jgi:conjugative relaxase-like TrwC/TraI family protein
MESRDCWHGKLSERLGLSGQVTKEEFAALLDKVEARGEITGKKVTPAMDITITANKSLSLAMTFPQNEKELQDIYLKSVKQTCDEIEKIIETRRGYKAGIQQHHKTGNACFAILNHEINRCDEPNKHCHIIMYNVTENKDGKLGAIYNLDVMKQQKEFGRIANQFLVKNLQDAGYELEMTDSKKGQWEMKGCTRETIMGQSKRRQAIEKYAKEHSLNLQDAKQMQAACLATRPAKNHHADLDKIKNDTQEYLHEQGYSVIKQIEAIKHTKAEKKEIFQQVLKDMEMEGFSFSQDQFIERIMNAGILVGITKNEAEQMLKHDKNLALFQNIRTEQKEYAFKSNIRLSEKNLQLLANGRGKGYYIESLKAEHLLTSVCKDRGITLTEEQRLLVLNALTCKDTICAANGEAGTGKTFSFKILHECCQRAGIEIEGMAPSGRAADGLQDDSGIKSTTLDHYIIEAEKESKRNIGQLYETAEDFQHKRTAQINGLKRSKVPRIIVVDESGMTDEIKLGMILDIAAKRGDKVILAGDVKQLQAIGVGHTMETFIKHGMSTSYMIDIQRQKEDELLTAVKNSVEGDLDVTFAILDQKAVDDTVKQYMESDGSAVIKADTIKTAGTATKMIRTKLKASGKLQNAKNIEVDGTKRGEKVKKEFAEGDRVILSRQNKKLGIAHSGITGTIVHIDNYSRITVRQDNGQETRFYADAYTAIDYAYAIPAGDKRINNVNEANLITATSGLREIDDYTERMEQVKQQYLGIEGNRKNAAICVSTNVKRETYNAVIRAERVQRGEIADGQEYILDDGQMDAKEKQVHLAKGDRIVFLKNTDKIKVKNGTMAQITDIDDLGNMKAVTDAGKEVFWNLNEFKSLDHAYAITVNKAQGMTVDTVIADQTTNEINDRNKFYVVVSRARYDATVYTDDKDKYRKQVSRWAEKSSYDDYERSKNIPRIKNGCYQNKKERAKADEVHAKLPETEIKRRQAVSVELGHEITINDISYNFDITKIKKEPEKAQQSIIESKQAALKDKSNPNIAIKEQKQEEQQANVAVKEQKRNNLQINIQPRHSGHKLSR